MTRIFKLLSALLVIYMILISCNSNSNQLNKVSLHKTSDDSLKKAIEANSITKGLLDSLGLGFRLCDKKVILRYWSNILHEKEKVIDYILTLRGNEEACSWDWRDLKAPPLKIQSYSPRSKEIMGLFILNAIYYQDITFASNVSMYDNSIIDTSCIKKETCFENILTARDNIQMDSVWSKVMQWRNNNFIGRPYGNSSIYWIGEPGGRLSRENIKKMPQSAFDL